MKSLFSQVAYCIDRAYCSVGLDVHQYAQRKPERAQKIAIWLLAIGQTLGYAGLYYIFSALLFSWDASLGWGKEKLTLAFMAAAFAGAAVSPFAGRFVDMGGSRWLLSGGMALGALALILLSTTQHYVGFIVCWLLLGVSHELALYGPCFAFVTRTTGLQASHNITLITLMAGFASTLALPAGAFLAESIGWRSTCLVFAAVVAFIGAPALYAGATMIECCPSKIDLPEAKKQNKQAFALIRKRPAFWLLCLAFPLIGFTTNLLLIHIIPILIESGMALSQAVLVTVFFGPMQVVGRLTIMLLAGRLNSLALTIVSCAGIFIAVLLLKTVGTIALAGYAFAILFGACNGILSILKPLVTANVLGKTAIGMVTGSMAVPYLIVVALSPQIGSFLWRIDGYDLALNVAAGVSATALITLLSLVFLLRRNRD